MCMQYRLAHILLRTGVAFTLVYAAVAGFVHPLSWVGYVPAFISSVVAPEIFLVVWGIGELVLAVWILSGWRTVIPAAVTALSMLLLVSLNANQMSVLFRDFGIAFAALALVVMPPVPPPDQSTA